jgi:hypothetical protein
MNNNTKPPLVTPWQPRVLLLGIVLALAACSTVEPWQRGHLAKPQMVAEPHPEQRAMLQHIYGGREATLGGATAQGGGCGCY